MQMHAQACISWSKYTTLIYQSLFFNVSPPKEDIFLGNLAYAAFYSLPAYTYI